MINIKKILCAFMTCVLSAAIIGCGNNSQNSGSEQKNTDTVQSESGKTDDKEDVQLTISAAASLKEAMADIEAEYKTEHPNVTLTFNFGSSGSLQKQIEQGAPCDVFISAGQSQMKTLADESLLISDTNKNLVKNQLVLVGPSDTEIKSVNDLTSDYVKHIAVGEPSSVPAGKYADEVLTNLNLKDSVSSKLTFAKDVKEVLAWTVSGNAEVGFVYKSDALSSDSAKIIETLPEDSHSPITYPAAVINSTKNEKDAKEFEDFLFSDKCKSIFEKYGYEMA